MSIDKINQNQSVLLNSSFYSLVRSFMVLNLDEQFFVYGNNLLRKAFV